jgi:hypothetical protein
MVKKCDGCGKESNDLQRVANQWGKYCAKCADEKLKEIDRLRKVSVSKW